MALIFTHLNRGIAVLSFFSTDGTDFSAITALDPTRTGKTSASGLPSGSMQWFRNRTILTKGRYGTWSNWIPVRIK